MRKLLLCAIMATTFACTSLLGQEGHQTTLVSSRVSCIVGQQYAMLLTDYSDKVYEYLKDNRRVVIDFKSADATIIQNGGTWFKPLKEGETDVNLCIYGEIKGNMGAPDYDNLLDEVTFHVIAQKEVTLQMPHIYTTWGAKRSDVDREFVDNLKYTNISSNYLKMTPSLPPDLMKQIDVYSNGTFETPLYLNYYNDKDELYATALVVANFNRVIPADKSPIRLALEAKGFVQTGTDNLGCFEMRNEETNSQVTCEPFSLQGGYVMAVTIMSLDYAPSGLEQVPAKDLLLAAYYQGNTLYINAEQAEGKQLAIYSLSGMRLSQVQLSNGLQSIEMPAAIPVIVRAGESPALKVLP